MNTNMSNYLKYILIGGISCVGLYGLWCIGQDVQKKQRRHSILCNTIGPERLNQPCVMQQKIWEDEVEETIRFTAQLYPDSTDRIERKGILVKRPHARAVILICHGFMCNKDDIRFLCGCLFSDYTTLSFDFRGHGEQCAGQVCTLGSSEREDVIGAVEFIRSRADLRDKPLIVYGFSMGAVASLLAQAEQRDLFDGAIWDCPFDSTDNVIRRLLDQINISVAGYTFSMPGKTLLQKYAYTSSVQQFIKAALKTISSMDTHGIETHMLPVNTVEEAKKITIPSFLIVCKKDKKAPVEAVAAVYRAIEAHKQIWISEGRNHFDSFFYRPVKYRYLVAQFIDDVVNNSFEKKRRDRVFIDKPVTRDERRLYRRLAQGIDREVM